MDYYTGNGLKIDSDFETRSQFTEVENKMIYVRKLIMPGASKDYKYIVCLPDYREPIEINIDMILKDFKLKEITTDDIVDVIHNAPATVVKWKDGTKTVVQVQPGDKYDKEAGLAFAICKKVFGNKGHYNEVFKKWID